MYAYKLHESSEFGVMQYCVIDQKMGVSVQQKCTAKHYLMTNYIVIYHFKSIVSLTLW